MNSRCFCASSAAAPAPQHYASVKPSYLAGIRWSSPLFQARKTAFASPRSCPLRNRAFFSDCLALLEVSSDVVATARPPDPKVLLQTSVLLLSLYFVTNFVVPNYVSKYLGMDKVGDEDGNPHGEDKRSDG